MNTIDVMTQARFWNKVKVIPESSSKDCWEWQGGTLPNGYGVASIGKSKTMLAHRFSASLTQDIEDKIVMHKCDNPLCVRPDHLSVGTQTDNMTDMQRKDRMNRTLNITAVSDIRERVLTRAAYAKKYNVTVGTIRDVQLGYTWRYIANESRT